MDNRYHKRILNINSVRNDLKAIISKVSEEYEHVFIKANASKRDAGGQTYSYDVSFESTSMNAIDSAEAMFRFFLPANCLVTVKPIKFDILESLLKYSNDQSNVRDSIVTINKCLDDYKPENICVGFNGGKDCTALLHLIYPLFTKKFPNKQLSVFYLQMPQTFPLLDNFVHLTTEKYNLKMLSYSGTDYKIALEKLAIDTSIEAIFMGTRASDLPTGVMLSAFQMTDKGWPQFMRVSPLLNWSYSQIWSFIRDNNVPYCSLYDKGYTSIGSTLNTTQNPRLRSKSRNGEVFYFPAYMLKDEELERSGRTK